MGLFGKAKVEERVEKLDRALQESFARVKGDTETIYQWLQHFHNQALQQQQLIEEQQHVIDDQDVQVSRLQQEAKMLRNEVAQLKETALRLTPENIRKIIDEHYAAGTLLERLRTVEHKLAQLEARHTAARPIVAVQQPQAQETRARLRERIVQKLTRHSKDYVKNVILGLITKYGKISALQLREIVVEEQGLVSRSSFYRILEELEEEAEIQVVSRGKEKVYVAGTSRVHHRKA